MKRCFKCGVEKPVSEFYRHPMMADGRLGKCKECAKLDVRFNRLEKADYYREYDSRRNRLPHRKKLSRDKLAEWRVSHPEKHRAWSKLSLAIKSGKVVRPGRCQWCGCECKPDGHHDDHNKPFDVMWLCKVCHAHRHREIGLLANV